MDAVGRHLMESPVVHPRNTWPTPAPSYPPLASPTAPHAPHHLASSSLLAVSSASGFDDPDGVGVFRWVLSRDSCVPVSAVEGALGSHDWSIVKMLSRHFVDTSRVVLVEDRRGWDHAGRWGKMRTWQGHTAPTARLAPSILGIPRQCQ